jgi:hypothetical protein
MKKGFFKRLNINIESVRKLLGHAISPVFLVLLLSSFVLWYATKLGENYDIEMPLNVRIDGQKYRVTAEVQGKGSTLLAQRLSLKSKISIKLTELKARKSPDSPNTLIITPESLIRAISSKTNDLKVVQIIEMPDFQVEKPKEKQEQPSEDKKSEKPKEGKKSEKKSE